eukprot:TRINITY_DN8610_c0_g1_i1.p1 TRINITY_DN8610_c0_g1~~TRINITY_DN8610_c0_g1_i1.p1  ORF type:complete len:329 (-),score=73.88 TRINITY_DN8610_c0_g1_i1:22-930(-)
MIRNIISKNTFNNTTIRKSIRSKQKYSIRNTRNQYQTKTFDQKRFFGLFFRNRVENCFHEEKGRFVVQKRTMFIDQQPTPNPDAMKFVPDEVPIIKEGSREFTNAMEAVKSPLAKMLFKLEYVRGVFIAPEYITITKDPEVEWKGIETELICTILDFYSTGEPVIDDTFVPNADTAIHDDDPEAVMMIKEIIETRLRPTIQDDGGDITYKGFIEGVVFLQFRGSCTSCPSSTQTLKGGIERILMHYIEEVQGVMAVETDEEFQKIAASIVNADESELTEEERLKKVNYEALNQMEKTKIQKE